MFDESAAGVLGARCHMFCFTTPRREGLELNSAKFELRTWPLLVQNAWKVRIGKFQMKQLVCLHHSSALKQTVVVLDQHSPSQRPSHRL